MSNDKLAEALRNARSFVSLFRDDPAQACLDEIDAALQSHAAEAAQATGGHSSTVEHRASNANVAGSSPAARSNEAAQAQAQSGEWVMVPREPTKAMIEAACKIKLGRLEALRDGHGASSGVASAVREEWDAMLVTAPQQQAAEPVVWTTPTKNYFGSFEGCTDGCNGAPIPLYTHPQPARDAALYQELLMAVGKKFPGEGRHETALRYIREAEYKSPESKCDAAMAKESGR